MELVLCYDFQSFNGCLNFWGQISRWPALSSDLFFFFFFFFFFHFFFFFFFFFFCGSLLMYLQGTSRRANGDNKCFSRCHVRCWLTRLRQSWFSCFTGFGSGQHPAPGSGKFLFNFHVNPFYYQVQSA